MPEILSLFRSFTKRDFIKIQILQNAKEHDCAQSICSVVINVLRSMIIYFPGLEKFRGEGMMYVADLTLRFGWLRNC
jgi:hypothetical protein